VDLIVREICSNDGASDIYSLSAGEFLFGAGGAGGAPIVVASSDGEHFHTRISPTEHGLRAHLAAGARIFACGEQGGLFVTEDRGATWKTIATNFSECLNALAFQDGVFVAGEGGFVARVGEDGVERIKGLKSSVNAMIAHGGALLFMCKSGSAYAWDGKRFKRTPLMKNALSGIAASPKRTLVAVGEGGAIFRKAPAKKWTRVRVDMKYDFASVAWTAAGFVVVGAEGVLLVSNDDGKKFELIETSTDAHLWSIAPSGSGAFIGGDSDMILHLVEEDDETWKGKPDLFGKDLTPREKEEEEEEEEERAEIDETPLTQAEIEKASERWIREGLAFKKDLNAYVRRIYEVGHENAGTEPEETRKDMAPLVTRAIVQLNRENRTKELRKLFPPSYEPFDYEDIGDTVAPVFALSDGRVLAGANGTIYACSDKIEDQHVRTFGASHDRRFFAKLTKEITVHEGWDAAARTRIALSSRLAHAGELTLTPFPDGERVLVSSDAGIFIVSEKKSTQLYPQKGKADLSYPHAALSPDAKTIALGCQDSAHLVFRDFDGEWSLAAEIEPASEYPNAAGFHDARPLVALASCHFGHSATSMLDLLKIDKMPKNKVFRASVREKDEGVTLLDAPRWVWAILPRKKGFMLGDRSGYVWYKGFEGELIAYVFIGSTINSLAQSEDKRHIVCGSYAGYAVELDTGAEETDPHLLTSAKRLAESRRWIFWRGFPPMVW